MGKGKQRVVFCDPLVAESVQPHLEAIEHAKLTIDTQTMIVNKILSAHFDGFRTGEYEYNPNEKEFELVERSED